MNIELSKQAIKYINKLDRLSKIRLNKALSNLGYDPPKGDIKTMQNNCNLFRLRVGDLRIVFSITGNTIIINKIAPRGEIYKD